MTDNPIEIPQNLRDMSEQSLKQAHAEYENLTDFVTKAMGFWMASSDHAEKLLCLRGEDLHPVLSKLRLKR